ncbi:hypothetical protein R3W88_008101 [Solanum pinnatisectum]|uniref:GRF-type domain-containing protein n=1 Tax=Solanum pinnatisectum TaxID=50273 RepID=A0AAV9M6Z1_9SOLN|nr:hypothetical protein R3W88_008101 [Solanum pinnatisectum]
MSQNLKADICNYGDYCCLKTLSTLLNSCRRFVRCKASKEHDGYNYFRWIDPLLESADFKSSKLMSYLMNRFKDGENPIDRLKDKMKQLKEERDSLKLKLNENEEKMMVVNQKLKEVKL